MLPLSIQMERKRPSLLQDFQSLINSTLASDSDFRPLRPSLTCQLGPLLADLRTTRLSTAFEEIREFEGWANGSKPLDFEIERSLDCIKYYMRKGISQTLGHWKRQCDRAAQLEQLQSASETISRMNVFSKHFMACTALHHFHRTQTSRLAAVAFQYLRSVGGNPLKEVSFGVGTQIRPDTGLLPKNMLEKWVVQGLSKLQPAIVKAKYRYKTAAFAILRFRSPSSPTALNEVLERLEFEKAELAISLQNKTHEVDRLVDMLEECKGWESKLTQVETGLRTETEKWKQTAFELQDKLTRKQEEIAHLQQRLKAQDSGNDEAQRTTAALEKELKELKSRPSDEAIRAEAETLRENSEKLSQRVEELESKLQEQIQETLDSEREKLVLLKKMNEKPSKKTATVPKRTMQLERAEVQEGQLALEIVRLNREVNKLKFEARTSQELQRKAEAERDDLVRQAKLKSDVIEKLRKENEQLAVSLSTDQYKSVQKLEAKIAKLRGEIGTQRESVGKVEAEKQHLKSALDQEIDKSRVLEVEAAGLRDQLTREQKKAEDAARALSTLNSLQERFAHLKEFGDKQITLTEGMKREKMLLEEQIEGLKANLRATKTHMDKAISDAEAYSRLLKQMEARLTDCNAQKQQAEDEVRSLRSRFPRP